MTYATDGTIGVKTDETYATTSTWPHALGEVTIAASGQRYMFVIAGSAISAGNCVAVNNSFSAIPVTGAIVSQATGPTRFAFANRGAIASGAAGWVALCGANITCTVIAGTAITPNIPLYTTDTAGALSSVTASASHFQVVGAFAIATASGSTATNITLNVGTEPFARRPIS